MTNMIEIRNVTFRYRREIEPSLCSLSCDIQCGQIVAIIGKSGIGKSTLLRLISGVYRKFDSWNGEYEGEIRILGRQPQELKGPEQVSLMTQDPFLLTHLSVKQNILLPCHLLSEEATKEADTYYGDLINCLGLSGQEDKKPMDLSGGMKTRVAFARAMISCPAYLFLDEPFTSLDIVRRWGMYKAIRRARSYDRFTTVLTTHDLWEALVLANWILVLDKKDGISDVAYYENPLPEIDDCSITECLRIIQPNMEHVSQLLEMRA